ncbi:MAG: extracellular solute-binding protein [Clostridia bacterium]|nr:extracellular solute-binding protein [Clostridia bacterium]
MKKIWLVLLLVLSLSMVSCNADEKSGTGDGPVEISLALWDVIEIDRDHLDDIQKQIEEKLNIKIVPMPVTWDDYGEKYTLWASSNQLPDMFGTDTAGSGEYYQWIEDGVIKALPSDLSAYPNVAKAIDRETVRIYTPEDGKIYFTPRITGDPEIQWAYNSLLVRQDWLDNLGLDMPETLDEWIETMVAFTKNDPDGNGLDDTYGLIGNGQVGSSWAGFGDMSGYWNKGDDGEWYLPIAGENAFENASFMRAMYKAGGLHPDFALHSSQEQREIFGSGKAGVLQRSAIPQHLIGTHKEFRELSGIETPQAFKEIITVATPPLINEYVRYIDPYDYWSEVYFNGAMSDEKMEKCLELLDFLYSEEGIMLMNFGIEGVDYEMDGENVVSLLPMKEDGSRMQIEEKYPITASRDFAVWRDYVQFKTPDIAPEYKEIGLEVIESRRDWKDPFIDYELQVEVGKLEAVKDMTISFASDWRAFIADTSDKSDEALYEAMKAEWDKSGYKAAREAVTKLAESLGK